MADVKRLKKKEYQNKKASCLSYVLQVIEDDLIMSCATKLKQLGYEVDTLCFDGLLVNKRRRLHRCSGRTFCLLF
jgi:hypothetical protein